MRTVIWLLRINCTVLLTKNCCVVRDPFDLAMVAASMLGGCPELSWRYDRHAASSWALQARPP